MRGRLLEPSLLNLEEPFITEESKVYRWEYPDGTPTTKEQRRHFEETGELPPLPQEVAKPGDKPAGDGGA